MHKSISLLTKASIFLIQFFTELDNNLILNLKLKEFDLSSNIQNSTIFDIDANRGKRLTIFITRNLKAQIYFLCQFQSISLNNMNDPLKKV